MNCMLASARSSDLLYSTVQITSMLHCHTFQAPNCATTVDSVDFKFRVSFEYTNLSTYYSCAYRIFVPILS